MGCDCDSFEALTLDRAAVSARARATPALVARLTEIAKHPDERHVLLGCTTCDALWQRAIAWNWGARPYAFRVPDIDVAQWLEEPFVDPDELLLYGAALDQMLSDGIFETGAAPCRSAGCAEMALRLSVHCLLHHVDRLLPAPRGRRFAPYEPASPDSLRRWRR